MKFTRILLIASFSFLAVNCGKSVSERHSKEYTLAVEGGDYETVQEFRQLVTEFNNLAGLEALSFTENTSEADSIISLTQNLQSTDGKVGWGQWVTQTREQSSLNGIRVKKDRTIEYSMKIELDKEYVKARLSAATNSAKHYELQKLFFHEVGHGLQMTHNASPGHVMYYEISGNKDFPGFFTEVAAFFE